MIGTLKKAGRVASRRPTELFLHARSFFLFTRTAFLRVILPGNAGVRLGENVRVQRLRCVLAERPRARVTIGRNSVVYENARIAAFESGVIEIGESSILGDIRVAARHRISIGKRFLSSWNTLVQDYDPHPVDPAERALQVHAMCAGTRPGKEIPAEPSTWSFPGEAIEIGDDVWMGANSTVLKGARIGSGCVVATGSVVLSGEYPPRSLIAGNPAKVIRTI